MTEYAVLWLPSAATPRRGGTRPTRLGRRVDASQQVRVTREDMDEKQVAEARASPHVRAARTMKIGLVKPLPETAGQSPQLVPTGRRTTAPDARSRCSTLESNLHTPLSPALGSKNGTSLALEMATVTVMERTARGSFSAATSADNALASPPE